MVNHGFGGGKLQSSRADASTLEEIAKCISMQPGVVWAHVVHRGFHYSRTLDEKKGNKHECSRVQSQYDLIFEMDHECDLDAVASCAIRAGHGIEIDHIAIQETSYDSKGRPGKHPKRMDTP